MKNPFAKQDNGVLIASVAIGSVAAGAAAYFLLTEKGNELRRQIGERIVNLFAKQNEPETDHTAYLDKPHLHPKSNREEILHGGPIPEQPGI